MIATSTAVAEESSAKDMEGINKKYAEMIGNFKGQMEIMIERSQDVFKEMVQASEESFVRMQENYSRAFDEMIAQMIRANKDMLEGMGKQYTNLKQSVKENYEGLEVTAKKNFDKNITKYRENLKEISHKIPSLPISSSEKMIVDLMLSQSQTLRDFQKNYFNFFQHLDRCYAEFSKRITINPEVFKAIMEPKAQKSSPKLSRKSSSRK